MNKGLRRPAVAELKDKSEREHGIKDFNEGVILASKVIDSGAARKKLEEVKKVSNKL